MFNNLDGIQPTVGKKIPSNKYSFMLFLQNEIIVTEISIIAASISFVQDLVFPSNPCSDSQRIWQWFQSQHEEFRPSRLIVQGWLWTFVFPHVFGLAQSCPCVYLCAIVLQFIYEFGIRESSREVWINPQDFPELWDSHHFPGRNHLSAMCCPHTKGQLEYQI